MSANPFDKMVKDIININRIAMKSHLFLIRHLNTPRRADSLKLQKRPSRPECAKVPYYHDKDTQKSAIILKLYQKQKVLDYTPSKTK